METEPNQNINNTRIETIANEILSLYQSLLIPESSLKGDSTEFTIIINKRKEIFDHILDKYHVSWPERARLNDVLAKKITLKKKSI